MNLDELSRASMKQLRDRAWLENAIWELGVYQAQEIPQVWWQKAGHGGIGICQFPIQFAPYLIELSKLELESYAEIGLWVGGTFKTTVTYLRRFGLKRALGVDVHVQPEVREFENDNVTFLEASSTSPEVAEALREFKPDLLLVDGDHTEEGCRADYELARKVAKYVAVHDIVGDGFPGVRNVWASVPKPKLEWVDQLEEQTVMQNGLGLVKT